MVSVENQKIQILIKNFLLFLPFELLSEDLTFSQHAFPQKVELKRKH
jgi:hypothetical protein